MIIDDGCAFDRVMEEFTALLEQAAQTGSSTVDTRNLLQRLHELMAIERQHGWDDYGGKLAGW